MNNAMCVCVRACVRACVCVCVCVARVRVFCVCVCVFVGVRPCFRASVPAFIRACVHVHDLSAIVNDQYPITADMLMSAFQHIKILLCPDNDPTLTQSFQQTCV